MAPKDKALELVEFFINLNNVKLSDYSRIEWPTAKQCAIKVVDEILIANTFDMQDIERYLIEYKYYQEVRQEIQKL
jgi:hypothetical protein